MTDLFFKSFRIIGLWDRSTVELKFSDKAVILIGENGTGKTTVLTIFYYLIKGEFFKLSEYQFENISIELSDNSVYEINSSDLFVARRAKIILFLLNEYGRLFTRDLWRASRVGRESFFNLLMRKRTHSRRFREDAIPSFSPNPSEIYRVLETIDLNQLNDIELSESDIHLNREVDELLQKMKKFEVIYFPTYRKVEIDSVKLGIDFNEEFLKESNLIEFGMKDVEKKINKYCDEIAQSITSGFSSLSNNVINFFILNDKGDEENLDWQKDVDAMLERLSNSISEEQRLRVLQKIQDGSIEYVQNSGLRFFLRELQKIFSSEKPREKSLESFVNTCNRYLEDKNFEMDKLTLKPTLKFGGKKISLDKLSSGEKQMITMFSKIFLGVQGKPKIILIDEPELSMSIKWQETFLKDITDVPLSSFVFAVTHSPFVCKEHSLSKSLVTMNEISTPYFRESTGEMLLDLELNSDIGAESVTGEEDYE